MLHASARRYWLTLDGTDHELSVRQSEGSWVVTTAQGEHTVTLLAGRSPSFLLTVGGRRFSIEAGDESVALNGAPLPYRLETALERLGGSRGAHKGSTANEVRAPLPGRVVRVHVEQDQQVEAGASLVSLEAMKMENDVQAPFAGTVGEVNVKVGDAVEAEQLLVRLVDEGDA